MKSTPTAAFVGERLLAGASPSELFSACEAADVDLAEVMDVLADPLQHFAPVDAWEVEEMVESSWHDPIYRLVEYAGPVDAAKIAVNSSNWSETDVVSRHAGVVAWLRAGAAITDEDPLAEAYALVADEAVPEERRDWLLRRLARVYPLRELTALSRDISFEDAAILGEDLRHHLSPFAAFEELVEDVDAQDLLAALERFWGVARHQGEESSAVLSTYALLARREFRPMKSVLRFASQRGDPAWWVPILREHQLEASHAALHMLEAGAKCLAIAETLTRGGYEDEEVLAGLLENGIGTRASLSTLRDSGWSVDRMAETLARRGVLLPQVRGHLRDLGISRTAQRPVLLRHWEESLVDLVLDDSEPKSFLLTSDVEPPEHE